MKRIFEQGDQWVRFLLLVCGLLMLAGAAACLVLGNAFLAVACSIVSAWAIGSYLDTVWAGIRRATEPRRSTEQPEQEDQTPPI